MLVNSYPLFVSLVCIQKYDKDEVTLDATTANWKCGRRRRKWHRQESKCSSLAGVLVVSAFLLLTTSMVSAHGNSKNWKTNNNGFTFTEYGARNSAGIRHYKKQPSDKQIDLLLTKGGTKWASASEEANDELHDAEILRAVQQSIAEWEERRRLRDAKHQQQPQRTKRSQPENAENFDNKEQPTKVCYEELGCFEEAGYIDLLPNSPEEVNTRYLLYNSRRSRGDTPLLDVSAQNVSSIWDWVGKAFNVSAPTKVIVHGFGSSCSNVWVYEMRSALMSVEDCNIICVDWENGATIPNYVRAAANTRMVGKQVAILLSGLETYVNVSLRNVHMIGFSLGAHVAGFAGSELKNLSRITGLDPAGPLFESQDRRVRLDSMDAQFVDVIHSNGDNLILGGLGAWQPMGHVDFYPNGGRMQKGCTNLFVGAVSDMIWSANEVYGRSLCNHRRAYKFFTDSVSAKCQFPAVPCESYDHFVEGKCFPCINLKDCSNMGYYADKSPGRGTLYLLTRDEEPFCANQYMAKVENSPFDENLDKKSITFGKLQILLIGDLELNETFSITQKKDEKLTRGESISRIIVPHPALQNFLTIQIIYTAYKGWLSSGEPRWRIDKISLINSYGHILSACKEDLELESGIPVMLELMAKDCNIDESNIVRNNHTTKSTAHDVDAYLTNHTFNSYPPHTQVIHLGDEILNTNFSLGSTVWSNTSSFFKPHKILANVYNVSKIGVGVTEYLNDSWKQKADIYDPVTTSSVLNNLDNVNYDNGEGRRLSFDAPTHKDNVTNETAASAVQSTVSSGAPKSHRLYEFVIESQMDQSEPPTKMEKEITEPVLKPKPGPSTSASMFRFRKAQNMSRPKYGKSINVVHEQSSIPPKRSAALPPNTYINGSSSRTTTEEPEEGNEFLDLEYNGRAFKRNEPETRNSSSQSFVVQFLPQRLVSFLELAERYARMAFLPFISPAYENFKNGAERTRRVRAFNTNRWSNSKKESNDRHDMDIEESVNVAESVVAGTKVASFPYPFHIPRQFLWQRMSRYPATARKYIPLTNTVDTKIVFPEPRDKIKALS